MLTKRLGTTARGIVTAKKAKNRSGLLHSQMYEEASASLYTAIISSFLAQHKLNSSLNTSDVLWENHTLI